MVGGSGIVKCNSLYVTEFGKRDLIDTIIFLRKHTL